MNGKAKCAVLKRIRRDIANANDIDLVIPECTHKGDCAGTCPRCESEVRYLESKLAERKRNGLKVVIAGISAGFVAAGAVACAPDAQLTNTASDTSLLNTESEIDGAMALMGDVPYIPETEENLNKDTELAIAGFIQENPESYDETESDEIYTLQGAVPYFPEEEYALEGDIVYIPEEAEEAE